MAAISVAQGRVCDRAQVGEVRISRAPPRQIAGAPDRPGELLQECFVGSGANPYYGVTFWSGRKNGRMPQDVIMANGRGMQILYILPSLELLVVQLADTERFDHSVFLGRLLVSQ